VQECIESFSWFLNYGSCFFFIPFIPVNLALPEAAQVFRVTMMAGSAAAFAALSGIAASPRHGRVPSQWHYFFSRFALSPCRSIASSFTPVSSSVTPELPQALSPADGGIEGSTLNRFFASVPCTTFLY
jgi:hypothetical protein